MPVGNHLPHGETAQGGPLKRELGERHIRLMALGACIGVGLFLGSAKAIEMAGPAIMLSYIIGGLAILVIMRALGEMAVHNPVAGSFSRYAQDYLGHFIDRGCHQFHLLGLLLTALLSLRG